MKIISRKITRTKYIFTQNEDRDEIVETSEVINFEGKDINVIEERRYRSLNKMYKWSKNSKHLEKIILKMSQDEELLIPSFLLRCQFIEFGLKFLLLHLPYKPDSLKVSSIDRYTMGQTISELAKAKDNHLDEIVKNSEKLKDFRNEMTHHLINNQKSIKNIEDSIIEKFELSLEIEKGIVHYIDFVEETLGFKFENL